MKKIFVAIFGLMIASLSAQQKKHTVVAKDNPYSIAKKYGVSLEELLKLNPKAKAGKLNIGDILIIPNKSGNNINSDKKLTKPAFQSKKTGTIYLQPKQTIYGITRQYKISEAELRQLNPDLDNNFKIGDAIILPEENIKKYGNTVAQIPPKKEEVKSTISDENVDTYIIQPKDTYYAITKRFNISKEKLFSLNPGLKEKGLQPGEMIKLKGDTPLTSIKEEKQPTQNHPNEEYLTYVVQKGDTVFGILNRFNISYEQLTELNGDLSNGLREGAELRIRKLDKRYIKVDNDVFNIALLLPFGFDSNDNKFRSLANDFLLGAKLAAERNTAKGKKISLNVIDAGNENSFKNNLSQINKNNTDLIIGPFFKSNVVETLNYVKYDNIPVVAPFAHTSDLYDYQNLILVETNNRVYAERIAKEVKQVYANQKIYIIGQENDSEVTFLKSELSKTLSKANISIIKNPLSIELEQNMMTGQDSPAILILANDNDNTGKEFTSKIIDLASKIEGIKAFSLYYHADFEKNTNALSKANLVYLMDRKINTEGIFEKEILADFRKKYCRTPSKYSVIGFDVMNDLLTRENKGDVLKQMDKIQTQLATKFEYIRSKRNGAFINTGYRVVRLIP